MTHAEARSWDCSSAVEPGKKKDLAPPCGVPPTPQRPLIRTSFPPMASNIFSSWTRSCWMLFIRMQGWRGRMGGSAPAHVAATAPRELPTLHGGHQSPTAPSPAVFWGPPSGTKTEGRLVTGTSS